MDKKVLNSMFENLLHIGNKTTYINPKMKDYIYGSVNGIHVIDLTKTARKLEEIKKELEALSKEGKKILFVATKLQSRDAFSKLAEATGHYYVNEKWVPGLLTNFKTISKRIAYYIRLLNDSKRGAFDVLTKKEKASKLLELEKLDRVFRGLKEMKRLPDIVFVADGVYDKKALVEAKKIGKKAFAILNTNGDIDLVDNFIPANTNSVKSVTFIAEQLSSLPKVDNAKR
jgi:small subunit ribosomal protein S2